MATPAVASDRCHLRFDRGTLLFVEPPPAPVVRSLPGVAWDARTASYRAPPWRYAAIARELERAGVVVRDEVAACPEVDASAWRPVELRPYQRAALCAWQVAGQRGVLALPTGSGKTRVAIAAIAATGVAALCLVPTRVLLHQWRTELASFYSGAVGIWGDGERSRAPVMVITFESAYRNMARLGREYGLLVVDEAHHFGVGMRDEALEMAIAPHRLGLTATPPSDEAARARLATLVGPTVYRASIEELAGRYLADFDLMVLHIPLDHEERVQHDAEMAVFRPFYAAFARVAPRASWADFVASANRSATGRAALAAWRHARQLTAFTAGKAEALDALLAEHRGSRVLVFTSNNDTAYTIARRNLIMPLTCEIVRKEREEVLARFRAGEIRALVSSRVLNEGIDVPDADVGIVVGSSHGEREHVQRVGRLLRPSPGKRAMVYELVAQGTGEVRQADRRRLGLGSPAAHRS